METSNEVAVVTGGARGIGVAICRRLAADGHPVAVNYATSRAGADALVDEIVAGGGRAVAVQADVADREAVDAMFAEITTRLGAPTIVINNAGLSVLGSAVKLDPADWDRCIAVNLSGAFYCVHAALPAMYDRGWGRVVFLGSPGGGRSISPGTGAYAAAKAGLVALTKALAIETARHGITVNTVVPGYVATDMTRAAGDAAIAHMQAAWHTVPPDAVAAMISYLTSAEAAYVSGEDIAVWLGGPAPIRVERPASPAGGSPARPA